MTYSLREFYHDLKTLPEIDTAEWDLTAAEWSAAGMHRHITIASLSTSSSRLLAYFTERYGAARGVDNLIRFLSICNFIHDHEVRLAGLGLLHFTCDTVEVNCTLLRVILIGFAEPEPPQRFAKHAASDADGILSFDLVMAQFRKRQTRFAHAFGRFTPGPDLRPGSERL